jgi:hypothetical protein
VTEIRTTPTLLGREAEIAAIDELITRVGDGRGGALVLRGEAGVGKTALLDALAERAEGTTVLRASGVESEGELAFAAVHRMCSEMLQGSIDELPAPQGAAVKVAFGLSDAEQPPDPFLVGLGVLNRLSFAAAERPLVCLIDDAQWLDRISAQTLAFAAHRLDADPVAVVFAIRDPIGPLRGLPEIVVKGLSPADSRALLASRLPAPIDERVRERFIDETHGNPLALLELPRAFSAAELAGGLGIEDSRSTRIVSLLDEGFGRRAKELPGDTRLLLLIAAAEPTGDPALLWRAAALLGIDPEAAAPAESIGATDGAPAGASSARRRHRARARPRSPRLAPRPRRPRTRRRGGRRARGLCRACPRTRGHGGLRGLPEPGRDAHRRSGATRPTSSRVRPPKPHGRIDP